MLLRQVFAVRQGDGDHSRPDLGQTRPHQLHYPLLREAGADAAFVLFIRGRRKAHDERFSLLPGWQDVSLGDVEFEDLARVTTFQIPAFPDDIRLILETYYFYVVRRGVEAAGSPAPRENSLKGQVPLFRQR